MNSVYINWGKGVIPFSQIQDFGLARLDKTGFYAIIGGIHNADTNKWGNLKLLYIGQAFDQTLRERIHQDHPAYECVFQYRREHSGTDLVVLIGIIKERTVERLTQQLFDNVECCLILCNQPLCNTNCKESYSGRDLQVINTGSIPPLKERCVCSET